MVVNKVEKKIKTSLDDVVKYQIITHCFFANIQITDSELNCLFELANNPGIELSRFCEHLTDKKVFKSNQSSRNAVTRAIKKGLIEKNNKSVKLSATMQVQSSGVVFLDFKILGNETKES